MDTNISKEKTVISVCVGGKRFFPCDNFKEASLKVTRFISDKNLGSNSFYQKKNAGMIFHQSKGIIANVSYNGKVWKSNGSFQVESEEITNLSTNDVL